MQVPRLRHHRMHGVIGGGASLFQYHTTTFCPGEGLPDNLGERLLRDVMRARGQERNPLGSDEPKRTGKEIDVLPAGTGDMFLRSGEWWGIGNDDVESLLPSLQLGQNLEDVASAELDVAQSIQLCVSLCLEQSVLGRIDTNNSSATACTCMQRKATTVAEEIEHVRRHHVASERRPVLPLVEEEPRLLPPQGIDTVAHEPVIDGLRIRCAARDANPLIEPLEGAQWRVVALDHTGDAVDRHERIEQQLTSHLHSDGGDLHDTRFPVTIDDDARDGVGLRVEQSIGRRPREEPGAESDGRRDTIVKPRTVDDIACPADHSDRDQGMGAVHARTDWSAIGSTDLNDITGCMVTIDAGDLVAEHPQMPRSQTTIFPGTQDNRHAVTD